MEGIAFYDAINDADLEYGEDHQGSNLVVISQIRDGMWHEVARVEQSSEAPAE
jgi:branched-chain amino acid transport system substrate-binding protein